MDLQIFHKDRNSIRTIYEEEQTWFAAVDICDALGISNSRSATSRLPDSQKGIFEIQTPTGRRNITFITEPGVHELTLTSNKPEAKAFRYWITGEVVPTILRTGYYDHTEALSGDEESSPSLGLPQLPTNLEDAKDIPSDLRIIYLANALNALGFREDEEVMTKARNFVLGALGEVSILGNNKSSEIIREIRLKDKIRRLFKDGTVKHNMRVSEVLRKMGAHIPRGFSRPILSSMQKELGFVFAKEALNLPRGRRHTDIIFILEKGGA